jgi:YD repeat-containing protein
MKDTGTGAWSNISGPYWQVYDYDEWNNIKYRAWRTWEYSNETGTYSPRPSVSYFATYDNSNNHNLAWQYDARGNLISSNSLGDTFTYAYDAAGRLVSAIQPGSTITQTYDGDGLKIKRVENGAITYFLSSSVLGGQIVAELNQSGARVRNYVYAGGSKPLVKQEGNDVQWEYQDPNEVSIGRANPSGTMVGGVELDPQGVKVDDNWAIYSASQSWPALDNYGRIAADNWGRPRDPSMACYVDGFAAPCPIVQGMLRTGAAKVDPNRQSWLSGAFISGEHPEWIPNGSLDTGSSDLEQNLVTIRDGGGGQFVWVPDGSGPDAQQLNHSTPHSLVPQNTSANTIKEKLNTCVQQLFGITYKDFQSSGINQNGKFVGYGTDKIRNGGNDTNIEVTNNSTKYDSTELKLLSDSNRILLGGSPRKSRREVQGLTLKVNPYLNFTANQLRDPSRIAFIQVFELGNSLYYITGVTMVGIEENPNTEPGKKLTDCVGLHLTPTTTRR